MACKKEKNGKILNQNKNDRKLKPNRKTETKAIKKPAFPTHWYYMATKTITVSDIKASLEDKAYDLEIWAEAGVLEVGMREKASMDFEQCLPDLQDEYSNSFLEKNKVKALFFVTLPNLEFDVCRQVMEQIMKENGGFFCADTDDFTPAIGI